MALDGSLMFKAVGLKSGFVYAEGTRADCMRYLQGQYPYSVSERSKRMHTILETDVLPELIIIRKG